LSRSTAAKLN